MTDDAAAEIGEDARLIRLTFANPPPSRSPWRDKDRVQALADLRHSRFALPGAPGPYALALSLREGRLLFDVRDERDRPLRLFGLSMGPFRRLVKDYELLLDSHEAAIRDGREARLQAIDMGRRGLHDEGARLLRARLEERIAIDHDTARRLFTLLCVLAVREPA